MAKAWDEIDPLCTLAIINILRDKKVLTVWWTHRSSGRTTSPTPRTWPLMTFSHMAKTRIRLGSVSARDSRCEVYEWLDELDIGWSQLFPLMPGNSVKRQHVAEGRGIGLISPIYRACLLRPNIHFVWNTKATSLLIENGQVRGVRGVGLRDGSTNDFHATSVVLATGGFESNLVVVLELNLDCAQCHREPSPLALNAEQLDRHALIQACVICRGKVKE